MPDRLILLNLPGGPYRVTFVESCNGTVRWAAAEMCACDLDPAGHWHAIVEDATSLADVTAQILAHVGLATVEGRAS